MITKNFKNAILGQFRNCKMDFKDENGVCIVATSSNYYQYIFNDSFNSAKVQTGANYKYCKLGNGTTVESEDDYKLENVITTLTPNSFSLDYSKIETDSIFDNEEMRYIYNVTNNTTENITVSEIGLFMNMIASSPCLLIRETFAPITILSGETKTFTIVLN